MPQHATFPLFPHHKSPCRRHAFQYVGRWHVWNAKHFTKAHPRPRHWLILAQPDANVANVMVGEWQRGPQQPAPPSLSELVYLCDRCNRSGHSYKLLYACLSVVGVCPNIENTIQKHIKILWSKTAFLLESLVEWSAAMTVAGSHWNESCLRFDFFFAIGQMLSDIVSENTVEFTTSQRTYEYISVMA